MWAVSARKGFCPPVKPFFLKPCLPLELAHLQRRYCGDPGGTPMRQIFASLLILMGEIVAANMMLAPAKADEIVSYVSDQELQKLFPGKFRAVVQGFLTVRITAFADGTLLAEQIGKSDTGAWTIRSGKLCIKFSKWLKGRIRCAPVTQQAGWFRTSEVAFRKVDG
jgi:hypothetical protein